MDIESLKENLIKNLNNYKSRVEDSELLSLLRERYQNLSPKTQKLIIYTFVSFTVYQIYSLPASYVSSSRENLALFKENRKLTRDMIRAGHIAKTVKSTPLSLSTNQLQSKLEDKIKLQQIMTEQKKGILPLNRVSDRSLLPGKINQTGLKIAIDKLNLRQFVQLGESFDSIESSRLMNMTIQADKKDPHYFNVEYEIATFSLPESSFKPKAKKRKSRLKRKGK